MGLSREIVSSKDDMVIWLREIPVMCCMFKNTKFAVLCRCFSIFEGNKTEVFSQTEVTCNFKNRRKLTPKNIK